MEMADNELGNNNPEENVEENQDNGGQTAAWPSEQEIYHMLDKVMLDEHVRFDADFIDKVFDDIEEAKSEMEEPLSLDEIDSAIRDYVRQHIEELNKTRNDEPQETAEEIREEDEEPTEDVNENETELESTDDSVGNEEEQQTDDSKEDNETEIPETGNTFHVTFEYPVANQFHIDDFVTEGVTNNFIHDYKAPRLVEARLRKGRKVFAMFAKLFKRTRLGSGKRIKTAASWLDLMNQIPWLREDNSQLLASYLPEEGYGLDENGKHKNPAGPPTAFIVGIKDDAEQGKMNYVIFESNSIQAIKKQTPEGNEITEKTLRLMLPDGDNTVFDTFESAETYLLQHDAEAFSSRMVPDDAPTEVKNSQAWKDHEYEIYKNYYNENYGKENKEDSEESNKEENFDEMTSEQQKWADFHDKIEELNPGQIVTVELDIYNNDASRDYLNDFVSKGYLYETTGIQ
jgi:hypothetical protein